ncbi:hypothetical protein BX666DRAFT_940159 [Dichotomocladium elegans]|nr:hypothetical protein BX666DRAFT_940159 [Dichotomocladium elegans]
MKNRLAFGSFHSQHFSVHQVQEWKYLLRNQLYPPDWIASQYPHGNCEDYQELEQVSCDRHNVMQEKEQCDEAKESVVENEQQVSNGLSKEAIEIFRHSEAYRKERKCLNALMIKIASHCGFFLS